MEIEFINKTWPELKEYIKNRALIILPIAQVEEHGPHLPIGCDTFIATEIDRKTYFCRIE